MTFDSTWCGVTAAKAEPPGFRDRPTFAADFFCPVTAGS